MWWLTLLPLVSGHNWMQWPKSRGGGGGAATTGITPRPSIRNPNIQVGANQSFVVSWSIGHASGYYFIVMHKDDEDKIPLHKPKHHGGVVLHNYLAEAPPEAFIYEDRIFQRWHVSWCVVRVPCSPRSPRDFSLLLARAAPLTRFRPLARPKARTSTRTTRGTMTIRT